jgi:hypothetical protein
MNEPKPLASLGPTLLARKGGAKPAMRPQLPSMVAGGATQATAAIAHDLEDLGWNDMGHHDNDEPHHHTPILALTPAPAGPRGEFDDEEEGYDEDRAERVEMDAFLPAEPEVLHQQRVVAAAVASPLRERTRRNAIDAGRRAAFTLRLDAMRHLKLRLASTVKNRSAQQLVTAALDKYLSEIPEVEALAAQVKRD